MHNRSGYQKTLSRNILCVVVHTILIPVSMRMSPRGRVGPDRRLRDTASMTVSSLAVLVIRVCRGHTVADTGCLGSIAVSNIGRGRVLGKSVGVLAHAGACTVAAPAKDAPTLAAVAGGVVVGRAGAETLLLAVMTEQGEFESSREDKEEAFVCC